MGTLFPHSREFPDYAAFPSLTLEAARAGMLPLLITALLLEAVWDHEHQHQPHTEEQVFVLPTLVEPPGVDLSWMNNSNEVASDIVLRQHDPRRRAFYAMVQDSNSMSPAVLEFASRNDHSHTHGEQFEAVSDRSSRGSIGGANDVTVPLTGVLSTGSAGTVTAHTTVALT